MTPGHPANGGSIFRSLCARVRGTALDHNFYRNLLLKNFHPYSYAQLAAEYPCIVVRTSLELNAKTSNGLLELKPDHCSGRRYSNLYGGPCVRENPARGAGRMRTSPWLLRAKVRESFGFQGAESKKAARRRPYL